MKARDTRSCTVVQIGAHRTAQAKSACAPVQYRAPNGVVPSKCGQRDRYTEVRSKSCAYDLNPAPDRLSVRWTQLARPDGSTPPLPLHHVCEGPRWEACCFLSGTFGSLTAVSLRLSWGENSEVLLRKCFCGSRLRINIGAGGSGHTARVAMSFPP